MAEIGKVSVRVTPDTRGFAAETRRKLKAMKDPKFKVSVELNTDYFNAQLKKFLAETNKEMLESRNRITIRTQLHVHKRNMQDDVRHIRDQYQSFADEESIEFQHHLAKSVSRNGDISDNVLGLDAKQFVRDLSRALRSQDFVADVDIRSREGIRGLKRRLERENIEVEAHVKVDTRKALKDINTLRGVMAETLRTNYDLGKIEVDLGNQSEEFMKSVKALEELHPLVTATAKEQNRLAQSFHAVERVAEQARRKLASYERDLNSLVEAREKAVQKERDATEELAEIRKQMNADPSKRNELIDRERNLVRRIAQIREQIHENAWESANEEVRLNERILRTRKLIERSTKDMARLSERGFDLDIKSQPSRKMVESLRSQVDEAAKEIETQHIDFEARLDEFSAESVRARLAEIARDRMSTVWVNIRARDIDRLRGFWARGEQSAQRIGNSMARYATQMVGLRLMWNTMKDLLDILPKLDMAVPQVAAWTAGITAGVSSLSWLIGSLLNIGGDVLKIANLALMAPSMITGAAGAFAILYRSFMDFRKVLPDVVSDWEDLGRVVSSKVWSQAEAPIRHLHETLKPLINLKVPEWAEALGGALGGVARGIEGGFASGHLEEFLDNSIKGTEAATNGFEMLASAIAKLVGVGSRFFPKLGEWFTDTMTDFDSWVTRNDKNGNLERWVDEGVESLGNLGRAFWNFGGILRQLGIGADQAGMPGLDKFADGLERLNQAMKSDEFMQEYTMGMTRFAGFMENIIDLGPQFSETLSTIWEIFSRGAEILGEPIGGFLEAVMNGINDPEFGQHMLEGLENFGEFIETISPGIEDLTREFGALFQIVSVAAKEWGPAFNEILEIFADLGSTLHPAMQEFLEATGPKLHQVLEDLRQPALDAADAIAGLVGDENFQELVNDVIDKVGELAEDILNLVTPAADAAGAFADWYAALDDGGDGTLGALLQDVVSQVLALVAALPLLLPVLVPVVAGMARLAGAVALVSRAFKKIPLIGRAGGPIGLVALAGTLIPAATPVSIVAGWVSKAAKAVGLDSEKIDQAVEDYIKEEFDGKSLFGYMWDQFKEALGKLGRGQPLAFTWEMIKGTPVIGQLVGFIPELGYAMMKAAGFDEEGVDQLKQKIQKIYEGSGVLGVIEFFFRNIWDEIKETFVRMTAWLLAKFVSWRPTSTFGGIVKWLIDTVIGWLFPNGDEEDSSGGGGADGSDAASSLSAFGNEDWGQGFWDTYLEPWISGGWDTLTSLFNLWEPIKKAINFLTSPLRTVWNWLTGKDEGFASNGEGESDDPLQMFGNENWGQGFWDRHLKPWLEDGWETLGGLITEWTPNLIPGMGVGTKLGGLVGGLLGIDEQGQAKTGEQMGQSLGQVQEWATGMGGIIRQLVNQGKGDLDSLNTSGSESMDQLQASADESINNLTTNGKNKFRSLNESGSREIEMLKHSGGRHLDGLTTEGTSAGERLRSGYTNKMRQLADQAEAQARAAKSRVKGQLNYSANSEGAHTGSTYRNGLSSGLNAAVGVARGIVSRIKSVLSFNASSSGRSIGQTFASGLRGMAGAVGRAASNLVSQARSRLPNSPADEGPFSGSGWGGWGESIGEELAKGLKRAAPEVAREAENLMGGIQTALDRRSTINPGVDVEATHRRGGGLAADGYREQSAPNVSVNVTSNAEDPLVEGRRLAGDIAYALKGRGY